MADAAPRNVAAAIAPSRRDFVNSICFYDCRKDEMVEAGALNYQRVLRHAYALRLRRFPEGKIVGHPLSPGNVIAGYRETHTSARGAKPIPTFRSTACSIAVFTSGLACISGDAIASALNGLAWRCWAAESLKCSSGRSSDIWRIALGEGALSCQGFW